MYRPYFLLEIKQVYNSSRFACLDFGHYHMALASLLAHSRLSVSKISQLSSVFSFAYANFTEPLIMTRESSFDIKTPVLCLKIRL